MMLKPVSLGDARKFVGEHHRHNLPPVGWKFGVGASVDGEGIDGVAVASRPVARHLDDGETLEVTRVCTLGDRNMNSFLYGAIARAAKALGYSRLVTYTLVSESGSSLRAAGWEPDGETTHDPAAWESRPGRPQVDLFGEQRRPNEPKVRWWKNLGK